MNCKTKRKSWRRLAAALLAALCLLTGSGAVLAAQAAGETATPESAASPEKSASHPRNRRPRRPVQLYGAGCRLRSPGQRQS